MERAWILIGMMGAGKSAVGRAIASLSNRPFVDTDQLLQARFGRSIDQIFKRFGEETFRAHETSILKGLEPGSYVLATGGGIVMRPQNWDEMRRLGVTLFLDAGREVLCGRLAASKKKRPLLEVEDWEGRVETLLEARIPLYTQADLRVELGSRGIDEIAQEALRLLRQWEEEHAHSA
jgi:shikimate kinase